MCRPEAQSPPFSSTNIQGFAFCICIPGLLALGLQSVCVHACGTLACTPRFAALLRHTGRRHVSSRSSWRGGRRGEESDVCKGAWWSLTYFMSSVPLLRSIPKDSQGLTPDSAPFRDSWILPTWLASPPNVFPLAARTHLTQSHR